MVFHDCMQDHQWVESGLLTLTTVLFIVPHSCYEGTLAFHNRNWDRTHFFTCHFFFQSLLYTRQCFRDLRPKKRCSVSASVEFLGLAWYGRDKHANNEQHNNNCCILYTHIYTSHIHSTESIPKSVRGFKRRIYR